jgi:8-oxo-dGTP pyrophosphatase MutT (NUDIX family)
VTSIRNISVGLSVRVGRALVLEGIDRVTGELFYRAIGGGIEFGETAEAALRREFREELDIALGAVALLRVIENIFEHEGHPGHEIAHVFAVESTDIDTIPLDAQLEILDAGTAVGWAPINDSTRVLYPSGVAELLDSLDKHRASNTEQTSPHHAELD